MFLEKVVIDTKGRLTLPHTMLTALGLSLSQPSEIIVELTNTGIVIRPVDSATPLTDAIATMDLPVADWDVMEQEIEAGRRS